jgi:RNA polymerase sigma-70 factor (ECF subfamily)
MTQASFQPHDDRFVRGLIRRKAQQVAARAQLSPDERSDIEHDLLLRVLQAWHTFDPEKGHPYKYATTVVERHVANLLRYLESVKRAGCRKCSLHVLVYSHEEPPTELANLISADEHAERLGRPRRSQQEQAELAMDIETAILNLPKSLVELARRLQSQTISEVSRETGIPRTTLNAQRDRIRKRFEDLGLRDYL